MVPVIRNVEGMNFTDIEKAINMLGEKVTNSLYDTLQNIFECVFSFPLFLFFFHATC